MVVAFFRRFRLDLAALENPTGDRYYIPDPLRPGHSGKIPWSIPYTQWIRRLQEQWANELGFFKESGWDFRPLHTALYYGKKTMNDFYGWLNAKVDEELKKEGAA